MDNFIQEKKTTRTNPFSSNCSFLPKTILRIQTYKDACHQAVHQRQFHQIFLSVLPK